MIRYMEKIRNSIFVQVCAVSVLYVGVMAALMYPAVRAAGYLA